MEALIDETYPDIKANSDSGRKILSSSRSLENGEYDLSFLADYSIRYQGCHHMVSFDNSGNGNNNGDGGEVFITRKQFARFRLCPSNKCSSRGAGCSRHYGDYVVDMYTFLEAYTESKERARRSICENASWECNCDEQNRDDDAAVDDNFEYNCEYSCYKSKGLRDCLSELEREQYERNYGRNENEFRLEEYARECREFENGNGNRERELAADDYYTSYYVGPYCAKQGGGIYLGMFTDDTCSVFADSSNGAAQYKELTGNALPYKSTSIVKTDCVSCIEPERYEEDNDDDGIEISDRMMELYQVAGKCETNMDIDYPVENACGFVAGLQTLDSKGTPSGGGNVTTTILTDVFAIMFVCMAFYVIYLYRQLMIRKK